MPFQSIKSFQSKKSNKQAKSSKLSFKFSFGITSVYKGKSQLPE